MKQAVIIAGGSGTRLKERLGDLPKPLIKINNIPLLQHQIEALKKYNIKNILILVCYKSEKIQEFCNLNKNWGLNIKCIDEGKQLGTAGAVLNVFNNLMDEFLVVYGDTFFDIDLEKFFKFHNKDKKASASIFLHPNDHPHDSDLVELDGHNNIIRFHNYPHDKDIYLPNLVNAAMYVIRKKSLEPFTSDLEIFDFCKHLFPKMLSLNFILKGYKSFEYIKDCGTPSRVDKVSIDIKTGKVSRSNLREKQKIVILDRDGTINDEVNHLADPCQFKLISGVSSAIKKLNDGEYRVCIATNQPVIARGECTEFELKNIHNRMETYLGSEGAFIDNIYYCPHHPDHGFEGEVKAYKKKCNCRKPEIGLIAKAFKDFNGSIENSWMIGDSTADILAANRMGLSSILVETGHAGSDGKYCAIPDFVMPDLSTAVDFILDIYPHYCNLLTDIANTITKGNIIAIGGQSRSGKSLTSGVLCTLLRRSGINAVILNTDRWLLSEKKRRAGVLGRHDIEALDELSLLLKYRLASFKIKLPTYIKKSRTQIITENYITINQNDVIIIEGLMALYLSENIENCKKYFIVTNESVRERRVISEYQKRGEDKNAKLIYESRLIDEYPWVEQFREKAINIYLRDEM